MNFKFKVLILLAFYLSVQAGQGEEEAMPRGDSIELESNVSESLAGSPTTSPVERRRVMRRERDDVSSLSREIIGSPLSSEVKKSSPPRPALELPKSPIQTNTPKSPQRSFLGLFSVSRKSSLSGSPKSSPIREKRQAAEADSSDVEVFLPPSLHPLDSKPVRRFLLGARVPAPPAQPPFTMSLASLLGLENSKSRLLGAKKEKPAVVFHEGIEAQCKICRENSTLSEDKKGSVTVRVIRVEDRGHLEGCYLVIEKEGKKPSLTISVFRPYDLRPYDLREDRLIFLGGVSFKRTSGYLELEYGKALSSREPWGPFVQAVVGYVMAHRDDINIEDIDEYYAQVDSSDNYPSYRLASSFLNPICRGGGDYLKFVSDVSYRRSRGSDQLPEPLFKALKEFHLRGDKEPLFFQGLLCLAKQHCSGRR